MLVPRNLQKTRMNRAGAPQRSNLYAGARRAAVMRNIRDFREHTQGVTNPRDRSDIGRVIRRTNSLPGGKVLSRADADAFTGTPHGTNGRQMITERNSSDGSITTITHNRGGGESWGGTLAGSTTRRPSEIGALIRGGASRSDMATHNYPSSRLNTR